MRLPNLTIPNGGTVSNAVDILHMDDITVYGPSALTGVATVQLSPDRGVTWHDTTTTVAVDAIENVDPANAFMVRIESSLAEAAERVFRLHGN